MLNGKNKESLRLEILDNLRQIYIRTFRIMPRLILRYVLGRRERTTHLSHLEYDNYWDTFWNKRDIFRTDLPMTKFDKPIRSISPFEFKRLGIVSILEEKLKQNDITSVLEVGSGAGLNLMLLAPKFPKISYAGLEPTESGIRISNKFINSPPPEFEEAYKIGRVENVRVIQGSILDDKLMEKLGNNKFDLVFTCAVLEQLNNYVDIALDNIFNLTREYFLFYEEWLEANYLVKENYLTLVKSDYFRLSWNYLNKYRNIEILERSIPALQPSWLKYGVVFGKKS